jgi:hypothetical protein
MSHHTGSIPPSGSTAAPTAAPASTPQSTAHNRDSYTGMSPQCLLLETAGRFHQPLTAGGTALFVAPPAANRNANQQILPFPASRTTITTTSAAGNAGTTNQEPVPVRQLGVPLGEGGRDRFESISFDGIGSPTLSNMKYINYLSGYLEASIAASQPIFKFFGLTADDLNQMYPKVEVLETLVEIENPTEGKTNHILNNGSAANEFDDLLKFQSRGIRTGTGIDSITINYEGIDSATKNIVTIDAKFIFQDIREMMSNPYSKLFVLDTTKEEGGTAYSRFIEFRLGWKASKDMDMSDELKLLDLNLRTHLVKYAFDMRRDGSISVDATYRGSFIDTLSGPKANILELSKEAFQQVRSRTEQIQTTAVANAANSNKVMQYQRFRLMALEALQKEFYTVLEKLTSPGGSGSTLTRSGRGRNIQPDTLIQVGDGRSGEYMGQIFGDDFPSRNRTSGANTAHGAAAKALEFLNPAILDTLGMQDPRKRREWVKDIEIMYRNIGRFVATSTTRRRAKALDLAIEQIAKVEHDLIKQQEAVDTLQNNITSALNYSLDQNLKQANLAKLAALRLLTETLFKSELIFYLVVNRREIEAYKQAVSTNDQAGIRTAIDNITTIAQNPRFLFSHAQYSSMIRDNVFSQAQFENEEFQVIPFMFYGTFIESVLRLPTRFGNGVDPNTGYAIPDPSSSVYNLITEGGMDTRIDFGVSTFQTPYTTRSNINFPLYYLPLSVEELQAFFNREVVGKGLDYYTINQLLLDINRKLLAGSFSACAKESNAQGFVAPRYHIYNGSKDERMNGQTKENKNVDQYFIYGGKDAVTDLQKNNILAPGDFGNYVKNLTSGIPHFFFLGKDRGILKNMKLTDIADQTVKTAIYYSANTSLANDREGNSGTKRTGLPPAIFQAEIDTIGFPLLTLGQLVYIDLKPGYVAELGELARTFKATGYYSIYKISHTMTKDTFSTKAHANIQIPETDKEVLRSSTHNVYIDPSTGNVRNPGAADYYNVSPVEGQVVDGVSVSGETFARLQQLRQDTTDLEEKYNEAKRKVNFTQHFEMIKQRIKGNEELTKQLEREKTEAAAANAWKVDDLDIFGILDP